MFLRLMHFTKGYAATPNSWSWNTPNTRGGATFEPWLDVSAERPKAGGHFKRAVAKAIYGLAYYNAPHTLYRALRDFANRVEAARSQAVVAIVFGLGGGTGSGIAVDLARHVSTRMFGRRVLVTGIGIAPCDGDLPDHKGGRLFATLNELDCLCDEGKNRGVVACCGELYRNPFTAGFIMIPQQHVWENTKSLAETHSRVDREVVALLTSRGGASLWETLRLLNWVAAPSTQHSAARTPWGPKWIHLLGFADTRSHLIALPRQVGLLPTYVPEFIEARVSSVSSAIVTAVTGDLQKAFKPEVTPQIISDGVDGSIKFILPSISKTDLALFYGARSRYESEEMSERILDHSLLLDQGLVLSERSTRLGGMAGATFGKAAAWIAVSYDDLRGPQSASVSEVGYVA